MCLSKANQVLQCAILLSLFCGKKLFTKPCDHITIIFYIYTGLLHTVQGISNYGQEFNIGFISSGGDTINTLSLLIQTQVNDTSISISALNGFQYEGTINKGSFNIDVPFQIVEGSGFNFRDLGLRIISSTPISIIGLSSNQNTTLSSFLALPYIEYPALNRYTYYGISSYSTSSSISTLLLVGNRNNTNFTMIPTGNITLPSDLQSNDSTNITIERGQVYTGILYSSQTLLITSSSGDLTGTIITANKPLSVIGGQDCIEGVLLEECNPIATQISPTITWGMYFLLPPIETRAQYTVIASEPNTTITLTCNNASVMSSQVSLSLAGESWSFVANSTHYCGLLSCNQRCYVAMFILTETANSTASSSVASILPIAQYVTTSTSITPLSLNTNNYYTVTIPINNNFSSRTLLVNRQPYVPHWSPIYNRNGSIIGYGFNGVFNNTVTISRADMGPLSVTVYGNEGTYSYEASTLLRPIFPRVVLSPQESCILEGSDWTIVSIQRLSDYHINFNIRLTSPSISK